MTTETKPVPLTTASVLHLADFLRHIAPKVDLYVAHSRDELRHIDGFPAGGEGGNGDNTATEAAALARYSVTSNREQARDDLIALVQLAQSFDFVLTAGLRFRAPDAPDAHGVCSAPGCHNWASSHTTSTGVTITDRCDDCWRELRCHVCGTRDREARRVNGYPACGACAKAEQRARIKEVA